MKPGCVLSANMLSKRWTDELGLIILVTRTYDVTLYQGELEAGSGRVTVGAGQTASVSLSVNLSRPNTIWSIGR